MEAYVVSIAKQALFLILVLTAPIVGTSMVVGLTISLFQATTQIQEQTLTFVPKLIATILALAFVGPWALVQLVNFSNSLLEGFPTYVK